MKWHHFVMKCKRCNKSQTVLGISFNRNGEILLELCCVTCGTGEEQSFSVLKMVACCIEMENESIAHFEGNDTIH